MLGHKLVQLLQQDFEVFVTLRNKFDKYEKFGIFDRGSVFDSVDLMLEEPISSVIRDLKPDALINAAGIVKQLPSAHNVIETLSINSILPHRLAELSANLGFRLISISTDCVFSGSKGNYSEADVADAPDLYGKSKHLGEVTDRNCFTLRTSIIGRELETRHGLLEWFLENRNGTVKGYSKAIFSGFPTVVFSGIIRDILIDHPNLAGLYHVSSEGISKLELLQLINRRFEANVEIESDGEVRIERSLNSDRFGKETGFEPLAWPEMIDLLALDAVGNDNYSK